MNSRVTIPLVLLALVSLSGVSARDGTGRTPAEQALARHLVDALTRPGRPKAVALIKQGGFAAAADIFDPTDLKWTRCGTCNDSMVQREVRGRIACLWLAGEKTAAVDEALAQYDRRQLVASLESACLAVDVCWAEGRMAELRSRYPGPDDVYGFWGDSLREYDGLRELADRSDVEGLLGLVDAADRKPQRLVYPCGIPVEAAHALTTLGEPIADRVLDEGLVDPDGRVRPGRCLLLALTGDGRALPTLQELLIARQMEEGLGNLLDAIIHTGPDGVAAVRQLASTGSFGGATSALPSRTLKRAAREALRALKWRTPDPKVAAAIQQALHESE